MYRLLSILVVGAFLLLPHALAADTFTPISQLTATVNLQTDGTAMVTENIFYSSPSPLDWTLFERVSNLSVLADGNSVRTKNGASPVGQTTILTSQTSATHWSISFDTTNVLIRHDDRDQFYFKFFENPGLQIYNISLIFNLPGKVADNALSGNIYAIGGALDPVASKTGSNTISYTATFASEKSLFTASASWPKGLITYNWWTDFKLSLLNLSLAPWVVLGILMPIVCFFVLIDLIYKRRKSELRYKGVADHMPSALSPLLVGVLVNKKVGTKEIVALIVDLCQRGYLVIVKKEDTFSLGRKRPIDEHLQVWEKDIIEQLFENGGLEVSSNEALQLNNQALFSTKVVDAFNKIYTVITSLEFFTENPHFTRIRYKLVGVLIYLFSSVGLIWVTVINSPNYLLIPFAAMIVMAFLILRFSPELVAYSRMGSIKRSEWVAFGNFLKLDQSFNWSAYERHTFEKYLPYAIVLGVTKEWAKRFDQSNLAIVKPDWFISYGDISVGELTDELVQFTSAIAVTLNKLKGPLVS